MATEYDEMAELMAHWKGVKAMVEQVPVSGELNIPVEALQRAFAAAKADDVIALGAGRGAGVFSLLPDIVDISVKTAAPLVVAAELERIAALWKPLRDEMREVDNRNVRSSALGVAIADLERRASELRGEV